MQQLEPQRTGDAGEIHEFKEDLRALDRGKRKDAVKKVIAAMTVGKDVSMLFPDVVNCMQTEDLELKKLVYLYLINYAKTQPDLAIMAVNTFVKVLKETSHGLPFWRKFATEACAGGNVLTRTRSPGLLVLTCASLVQDTQDPNPLIRALAVRTMGCIRVDKITEYLCDPLQRCLKVIAAPYDPHESPFAPRCEYTLRFSSYPQVPGCQHASICRCPG